MKFSYIYKTKIGNILIVQENDRIIKVSFNENESDAHIKETDLIKNTINQIEEYLNGQRKCFDVPILFCGTEFQKRVWNELLKIPYGKTCTYGEIAVKIGNKNASRAVGMANHNNKIAIIVPCHRVIGKNGDLVRICSRFKYQEKIITYGKRKLNKFVYY